MIYDLLQISTVVMCQVFEERLPFKNEALIVQYAFNFLQIHFANIF
jgi:hypothetical protein